MNDMPQMEVAGIAMANNGRIQGTDGHIHETIQMAEKDLAALIHCIGDLESRLSPVMRLPREAREKHDGRNGMPGMSPIGEALVEQRQMIQEARKRIEFIIDRLDV